MKVINRPGLVRVIRAPRFMRVRHATFIPSGMHGAAASATSKKAKPDHREAAEQIVKSLVAKGVSPQKARGLVVRAAARHHGRTANRGRAWGQSYKYMRRAGLSDDEIYGPPAPEDLATEQALASIVAHGNKTQSTHKELIARIPSATSDSDRLAIRNAIDGLYNDWTQYAVGVKNGAPPFEWNRTNPIDAILIAVRDDLRDTVNLFDANKAQQILGKNISMMSKFGMPTKGGPLFNVDVPWYVWAGGAAAALGVAWKAMH